VIVLDASVLIAHLDADDALHADASDLLRSVAEEPLRASPLTEAEVLVGPARTGRLDRAIAALAQLQVRTVPFGDDAPVRLAMLRAETRLKLPDCCVLLAAEQLGAARIATFDDRIDAAARHRGFLVLGRRPEIPEA
jgi:predicted nucleic acid-binding protein